MCSQTRSFVFYIILRSRIELQKIKGRNQTGLKVSTEKLMCYHDIRLVQEAFENRH